MVFAEEVGGVEQQESGWLDVLADVASAKQEFEEQEENKEDGSEEAPQDVEEENTVSHDSEEGEKAPQGCVEVGKTPGHLTEEAMPRQDS